jgi:hypothetical protein
LGRKWAGCLIGNTRERSTDLHPSFFEDWSIQSEPWQTEHQSEFPLNVVCSQPGNSPQEAQLRYLHVTEKDFVKATGAKKVMVEGHQNQDITCKAGFFQSPETQFDFTTGFLGFFDYRRARTVTGYRQPIIKRLRHCCRVEEH